MIHILAFAMTFPPMCLLVVMALGRFQVITGAEMILVALWIAYLVTILPGLISAIADYLLTRRGVRFRFLYCALVAAIISPIVSFWYYPGTPYFFVPNIIISASIGAASAMLCSLTIGGVRSLYALR